MLKQKYTVSILLIIFTIFFLSVVMENNLWGNILSPIVATYCTYIILRSLNQIEKNKSCWYALFYSTLIWAIADFLWLIYETIFSINPIHIYYINVLYTLSALCLAAAITYYYAINLKKWNLYQLILDLLAISTVLVILLWSFIFSKTGLQLNNNSEYVLTMIGAFFDFYILSGMCVAIISSKLKIIIRRYFFIIIGMLAIVLIDYYYIYLYLMEIYRANTVIDGVYMFGNVMFAVGAVYETSGLFLEESLAKEKDTFSHYFIKPQKLICALFLFYLLYIINFLTLKMFAIVFFICIIYWIFTTEIQESIYNKYLLKTELEINEHLEKIVAERTKELTKVNQYLEDISNKDSLTGLYNRRYLIKYLDSLISRDAKEPFALIYIDTNHFKAINDSYGHQIGDKVLWVLGDRFIKNCMPDCTSFRIGGDEFAVIIEHNTDKRYVSSVAEKILEIIQAPISIPPHLFTVSSSIGIVTYPIDAKDKELLMRYADIAMYEAKKAFRGNNYLFFACDISQKVERKNEIEFLLKRVRYNQEFMLLYQPQYSADTRTLIGMEALIRWKHPEKGYITPGEFIPIAEEIGEIISIGEWVIDNAFSQIKKWNEKYSLNLRISINVSPVQIEKKAFSDWLKERIQTKKINPSWIDLEITEGSIMNPNGTSEEVFTSFAQMGISTSIDDFGTGYSSLSYIKKYDFNRLKIAKELIDNIYEDKNDLLIVQAIIMMAKGMGLRTIAEGVEDINQLNILKNLGCDEIQGFYFGKPVSCEEFEIQHINKT